MTEADRLVGADRCWPCTVANGAAAALVAGVPLLAGWLDGEPLVVAAAVAWALCVLGYTLYRLLSRGYLPGAGRVARWSGLHERVGPGAAEREEGDADRRGR